MSKTINEITESLLTFYKGVKNLPEVKQNELYLIINDLKKLQLAEKEPERFGYYRKEERSRTAADVETHESFGTVSITKPQGVLKLVGAMTDALPSCVELKVSLGERIITKDTHCEYWHSRFDQHLLTIRMSNYQWAEAICSMNGTQIPCTIKSVMGVSMDPPPENIKTPLEEISDNAKSEANRMNNNSTKEFVASLDSLILELNGLKIPKKKFSDLSKKISDIKFKFIDEPKNSAIWASQRLAEASEQVVSQAKLEVAAALTTLLQQEGLDSLKTKLLNSNNTPQIEP